RIRPEPVSLFVNGTLMCGLVLHANLADATYVGPARTAPRYRLYAVRDDHPAMITAPPGDGTAVSGEIYQVALSDLQPVPPREPEGLGLGVIDLDTGESCLGILWTSHGLPQRAVDISVFGGWREYQASLGPRSRAQR